MIHCSKSLKKTLPQAIENARILGNEVEVWAEDEHRIGLKPVLRKVLAPQGQRPIVEVNPRYQWLWLVAFVEPMTGRNIWFLVPYLTIAVFQVLIDAFALELKIRDGKKILLVVDQATWHTSKKLIVPKGIEFVFLPSHSPELQPAEHLWALSDEVVFNKTFTDLDQLERVLSDQCENLEANTAVVRSATLFYWWEKLFIQIK